VFSAWRFFSECTVQRMNRMAESIASKVDSLFEKYIRDKVLSRRKV